MSDPDRIRTDHDVTALVAFDTVELLHARVVNLCSHGRRITTTRRYTHLDEPPVVHVGLTLDGPVDLWRRGDSAGVGATLSPGIAAGFSFNVYAGDGCDTESLGWLGYHHPVDGKRRNLTEVRIVGGVDGRDATRDDLIEIRWWNSDGVCTEQVIAFDYATRVRPDVELSRMREELRTHIRNLRDMQPWDNRIMFDRMLAALDAAPLEVRSA